MPVDIIVEVINGRDNKFGIKFSDDNGAIDLVAAGVSRVIVDYDGTDLDTDDAGVVAGDNIDWTTQGASGIIIFKLGTLAAPMTPGNYICSVIIFDATNTNGQEWKNIFQMNVSATKEG